MPPRKITPGKPPAGNGKPRSWRVGHECAFAIGFNWQGRIVDEYDNGVEIVPLAEAAWPGGPKRRWVPLSQLLWVEL